VPHLVLRLFCCPTRYLYCQFYDIRLRWFIYLRGRFMARVCVYYAHGFFTHAWAVVTFRHCSAVPHTLIYSRYTYVLHLRWFRVTLTHSEGLPLPHGYIPVVTFVGVRLVYGLFTHRRRPRTRLRSTHLHVSRFTFTVLHLHGLPFIPHGYWVYLRLPHICGNFTGLTAGLRRLRCHTDLTLRTALPVLDTCYCQVLFTLHSTFHYRLHATCTPGSRWFYGLPVTVPGCCTRHAQKNGAFCFVTFYTRCVDSGYRRRKLHGLPEHSLFLRCSFALLHAHSYVTFPIPSFPLFIYVIVFAYWPPCSLPLHTRTAWHTYLVTFNSTIVVFLVTFVPLRPTVFPVLHLQYILRFTFHLLVLTFINIY